MRRLALLVPLVVSASAPARADDERDAAQGIAALTTAIRGHDARAIARLMHAPVTNTGVWFPDPACRKQFGAPGTILTKELEPFARCLAQLRPQISTRRAGQRDGAVLTYDPGIELHVAFAGALVRAIGFEAQTSADATIPTLTVQAFEALRTAGTTLLDHQIAPKLHAELAHQGSVFAWIKVCLDARGAITTAWTVASSSTPIGEVFRLAIADWRFRPFEIRAQATPVCSLSLLTYPATKAPPVESLPVFDHPRAYAGDDLDDDGRRWTDDLPPARPPTTISPSALEALRVSGSSRIWPTTSQRRALLALGTSPVVSSFKLCVDVSGKVASVALLKPSGVAAYDGMTIATMRRWAYRAYRINGTATPVCTAVTFRIDPAKP